MQYYHQGKRPSESSLFFAGLCTYPIYNGSKDKEKQKQRPFHQPWIYNSFRTIISSCMNIQMGKSLLLMAFLFCSKASDCFLLTNMKPFLLESLMFLEIGGRRQTLMSFSSTSKPESWQISIKTCSKSFFGLSLEIPDNSVLLLGLGLSFFQIDDPLFHYRADIFHSCQFTSKDSICLNS